MIPYINIHTHKIDERNKNIIAIKNIELHKPESINNLCSAGWHPWYLNNYTHSEIEERLNTYALYDKIIAIGECGIDRHIDTDIEKQKQIFELHIQCALKYNKPLIIHCVKAYSDMLGIFNRKQIPAAIFHAYNGNLQQSIEFLKYQNVYFSFGQAILNTQNTKIQDTLKNIPSDRLFFETDNSDKTIENIYIRAAEIKNISSNELKKQLTQNFSKVFTYELVKPH
jgi:TatD DNase family protein